MANVTDGSIYFTDTLWGLLLASAAGSLRNPARTSLERRREIDEIEIVIAALIRRIRGVAGRIAERVDAAMRTATRPVSIVGGVLRDVSRTREELVAENTALRQQLIVVARTVKKPKFAGHERGLVVLLARLMPRWREAMLLVKPETVLRWHREGFRLFWRARSRPPVAATPRIAPETASLGAELVNHMHQTWACDFLQLYDIWFQPIFAFFIIDLGSRKVVHVGVTRNPTTTWVAQQLRNATPFGEGPRFLIRDNDDKFGVDFDRAAKGAGVRVLRTAVRAPRMNAFCERFLGSARRECLDHVVVFGERHLERVLREYCFDYFNCARPHRGIGQLVPIGAATSATGSAEVVAVPVLNGLHHDYRRAA